MVGLAASGGCGRQVLTRIAQGVLLGIAWACQPGWAQANTVQGIYTCVDAQGRRLSADRPIPDCRDREQRVLNPSGTLKTTVGPALSPQDRADSEAKRKQADEERARLNEERRRERALLNRFPNQGMHDKERADALTQVAALREAIQLRITDLKRQQQDLSKESEFYAKDPAKAPAPLKRRSHELEQGLAIQDQFLRDQDAEIQRLNTRFDEELARLKLLWAQTASAASGPPPSPR